MNEQEQLVQRAIDEVTNPKREQNCYAIGGMSYRPPKPIVETLGHLGQHSEGTLADLLNTVRRMAETTCEDYDNQLHSCGNRLNESQEYSSKLSEEREALVHELLETRETASERKKSFEEACGIIAKMHKAATGLTDCCSPLGAVDDMKLVREENLQYQGKFSEIMTRLGLPFSTAIESILDHIDWLKNEAQSNARLQDVCDDYRATIKKLEDELAGLRVRKASSKR